jgi:hypothetical protein
MRAGFSSRSLAALTTSPPGEFVETWNPKGFLGIIAGKGFLAQSERIIRKEFGGVFQLMAG